MAFADTPEKDWSNMSIAVVGCGPVAICAIISALEYRPKQILAIDSIPERLERAKSLGCIPINFKKQDVKAVALEKTSGNGVDAVIEIVGLSSALKTAYDIAAIGARIASVGAHLLRLVLYPANFVEQVSTGANCPFPRLTVTARTLPFNSDVARSGRFLRML